jgi:hypothetical protein
MSALEEDATTEWLVTYLEADATLSGMTEGPVAPEVIWGLSKSPFVRIDRLDTDDLMVVGLHRVWVDQTYHVRGVLHWHGSGRPDRTEVNAIGARLDALLHDHEEATATHHFHSFREEGEPTPATTEPDGSLWLASGGIFRIRCTAL